MNEITVYHGSTEKGENPICRFGRKHLDFGQGFYVTNLREQAVAWANNRIGRTVQTPTQQSNVYSESRYNQQTSPI